MPVAYFLLFLVSERPKINILGIGRDKSQSYYFPERLTEPEGELERGHRVATPPLGAGMLGPQHRKQKISYDENYTPRSIY